MDSSWLFFLTPTPTQERKDRWVGQSNISWEADWPVCYWSKWRCEHNGWPLLFCWIACVPFHVRTSPHFAGGHFRWIISRNTRLLEKLRFELYWVLLPSIVLDSFSRLSPLASRHRQKRQALKRRDHLVWKCCRSTVAECVQEQRVGNSAHAAGDVQLQTAPHSAPLQNPIAQPPPHTGLRAPNQPKPAAFVASSLVSFLLFYVFLDRPLLWLVVVCSSCKSKTSTTSKSEMTKAFLSVLRAQLCGWSWGWEVRRCSLNCRGCSANRRPWCCCPTRVRNWTERSSSRWPGQCTSQVSSLPEVFE